MPDWLPPEFVAKVRARHERLNSPEALARLRQQAAPLLAAATPRERRALQGLLDLSKPIEEYDGEQLSLLLTALQVMAKKLPPE
jgi:hypothetical protein